LLAATNRFRTGAVIDIDAGAHLAPGLSAGSDKFATAVTISLAH
jgi:hypothetical protein